MKHPASSRNPRKKAPQGARRSQTAAVPCADDEAGRPNMPVRNVAKAVGTARFCACSQPIAGHGPSVSAGEELASCIKASEPRSLQEAEIGRAPHHEARGAHNP